MSTNLKKYILLLCFSFFILVVTVLDRTSGLMHQIILVPFQSYVQAVRGDKALGNQIILNIGLFIPFGFIMSLGKRKKKEMMPIVLIGFLFSFIVELLQYHFSLGFFEMDDLIDNTFGTVIGVILYQLIYKVIPVDKMLEKLPMVVFVILMLGFVAFTCIYCKDTKKRNKAQYDAEKEFYFEVDELAISDGKMMLKGSCFIYEETAAKSQNYVILLKSLSTGAMKRLRTATKLKRQDVGDYFACEYDYSECGFEASFEGLEQTDDYEIYVEWKLKGKWTTGLYLIDGKVSHVNERQDFGETFQGTLMEDVIRDGICLADNEVGHCRIYQYQDKLFWIVGQKYVFEPSEKTRVFFHLWTTQTERISQNRLDNGYLWDNIDFTFEENEVKGSFGDYRVAVSQLPSEYAVICVATGDFKGVWKECFRPMRVEEE